MSTVLVRKGLYLFSLGVISFLGFNFFGSGKIDFNTQVKPIFNRKCIACHGGVKKQGGFSLLFEEEAKSKVKSGKLAIVPGHPEQSELIHRIKSQDPEDRMPYKHDPLSKEEISILNRWIKQGAVWGKHWSYIPVKQPVIPTSKDAWIKNNIDQYLLKEARSKNLHMSPVADAYTLARRVSLDLIGIQSPDSITYDFTQNPTEENYAKLVDRLLASKRYGERWTAMWLDLARYADTKGYERDDNRTIWRYRDWLINAFNKDKPYNLFLQEQIAGDLLPDPTDDQLIATAYHRNTMTNDEGGTDNEEFRTAAIIDRVNTTWQTLMGTTFACVQCHAHPYDPFKHEDYYKFYAFFNNTRDADTDEEYPWLRTFDTAHQLKLESFKSKIQQITSKEETERIIHFIKTYQPSHYSLESDQYHNSALIDTKWLGMRRKSMSRLPGFPLDHHNEMVIRYFSYVDKGTASFRLDQPNGVEICSLKINHRSKKGMEFTNIPLMPIEGRHDVYILFDSPLLKDSMSSGIQFDFFHTQNSIPWSKSNTSDSLEKMHWELITVNAESTPIMIENGPVQFRKTQLFERGNWLIKTTEVSAGTPGSLIPFADSFPNNRLGLVKWLTTDDHPLTARTMVNRLWEQLWGVGIVETLEDMGSQGASPSNQELLDYLAWSFVHRHHWSIKSMLKEMVMSAAYRQSSNYDEQALRQDAANKYCTRGPRIRLTSEQIRDQVLMAANVMDTALFGPSVMPYQPKGIWASPYSGRKWTNDEAPKKYRRALYTFWKRTSAYPGMTNFDMTEREVCLARRIRTNTPLQALNLLNDSVFIDLSNVLVNKFKSEDPKLMITKIYKSFMGKDIEIAKSNIFLSLYYRALIHYYRESGRAGQKQKDQAMALVANAIINLDEVITKS